MLRFAHRRIVDRILRFLQTAGAEPRLFFILVKDSVLRQEVADTITEKAALQQIPTLITPGDPVSKAIQDHKGSHANTKLFFVDGLTEAIDRGGEGFFQLFAKSAGYYTNYGTWSIIWISSPESRLRVEREASRLFQAATFSPVLFTDDLLEPRPGPLPKIAIPQLEAGDPYGRICAFCARIRKTNSSEDRVLLADELFRLGERDEAQKLYQAVFDESKNDPWRIRAAQGLYHLSIFSLDQVRNVVHPLEGEDAAEAFLLLAELESSTGDFRAAEVSLEKALSNAKGDLKTQAVLAMGRFLRKQEKPKESLEILTPALPSQTAGAAGGVQELAEVTAAAPLLVEAAKSSLSLLFQEENPSEKKLQKVAEDLKRARILALTGTHEDYKTAHEADTTRAGLLFAQGKQEDALALLEKAIKRAEQEGLKMIALDGYRLRMSALFDVAENSGAMRDLIAAVHLAKTIGYPDLEAEVQLEQADLEERMGNTDKAKELRAESAILQETKLP